MNLCVVLFETDMHNTVVYSAEQLSRSIKFIVHEVNEFAKFDNRPMLLHDTSAGVCTQLKSVLNIKYRSALDAVILESILNSAISAESQSPTAFSLCVKIVNDILTDRARGQVEFDYVKSLNDSLNAGVKFPTGSDVRTMAMKFLTGDVANMHDLFLSTVDLAGADGTVMIERSPHRETVELVVGYVFDLVPAINVSVKLLDARVIIIDGFIESVSEIHRLLEDAAQTKEPVAVFVRGMSPDVQHTLAVNYTRGSLRVVPIIVPFDVEGINTLKDIAVIAGSDVISSNKGDLISGLRLDSSVRVEKITVYKDKIIFANSATSSAVSTHIRSLQKLREDKDVEALGKLYDKRIKALSPRHVIVRLRDDLEFIRRSQALDYAFRGVRSLRDYGTIEFNTPVSNGSELTMTAHAAVKYSLSFVKLITNVNSAVIRA